MFNIATVDLAVKPYIYSHKCLLTSINLLQGKQARKGFWTKDQEWDFMVFRIQMTVESSRIAIRVLFGNAATYFLIWIQVGKRLSEELCSHLFLSIGKVKKMSSEFFKNSDDSGILMEFFKNFDQNTGGKLEWQIHQLILKHFYQNSTCKSFLKIYDIICFCL